MAVAFLNEVTTTKKHSDAVVPDKILVAKAHTPHTNKPHIVHEQNPVMPTKNKSVFFRKMTRAESCLFAIKKKLSKKMCCVSRTSFKKRYREQKKEWRFRWLGSQ